MRVLHVIGSLSPEWGGLSQAVAGLCGAMARLGLEIEIVTTDRADEARLQPDGVKIQVFSSRVLGRWRYARDLGLTMSKTVDRADLVHIHGLWLYPHLVAARAALRACKPYVVSPHGMLDPWALAHKRFRKRIYGAVIEWRNLQRAAAIHAVSHAEASEVARLGLAPPVVIVPNGIDGQEFVRLPDPSVLSQRYPALAGKIVLLFLGRIHPIKGLDLLIRSFCEIASRRDDVFLMIAGPDEVGYRRQLESGLEAKGVAGRYLFAGMLQGEERLAALAGAHLFVLPSYSEGLSVAALEAMASGLPVVLSEASDIPGVNEAGAGFVVPPQADALGFAIRRLVDDPGLREAMGRRGRHLVLTNYAWDRVAAQMIDVYKTVLAGGAHERLQHAWA